MAFITMSDIRRKYAVLRPDGHYFDRDTTQFFQSRYPTGGYEGPGGIYFAHSNQSPFGGEPRFWMVKHLSPDGRMSTISGPGVSGVMEPDAWPSNEAAQAEAKRRAVGGAARRRSGSALLGRTNDRAARRAGRR